MRGVGLSDLDAATRALLAQPRETWQAAAAQLIDDAHTADLCRKRLGQAHPNGGTGSLYAQARLGQRVTTRNCGQHYCAALSVLLQALEAWRNRCNHEL